MSLPNRLSVRAAAATLGAALLALALLADIAAAQNPTNAEAQQILQSRPEVVSQLRQRLAGSGLTPDQVRARLRAAGYSESLLDAYLVPTDATPAPTEQVFSALAALERHDEAPPARAAGRPSAAGSSDASDSPDGTDIFGLDIFRGHTNAFDPALAGPVDASYVLGPGDQLVMVLTGEVEMAQSLDVTRDGLVVVPRVGQMHVANLTLGAFETLLLDRLSRVLGPVGRGADAPIHVSLTVSKLRVNQVFVVGDVLMPGSYQVSSAGTALTALYAAGGPNANGSMRRVEVRRNGRVVGELDIYDYLLRGDASRDVRLQTGDVVFVPVHGPHVRVGGEVVRPARYELRAGESLSDLLATAGGFTPRAAQQRVTMERILPTGQRGPDGRDRVVLDVAPAQFATTRVEDGDVVHILRVTDVVRDRVSVVGSVWQPGTQALRAGMRVSDALRAAGGLRPEAYLHDVLVTRPLPDSTYQQLRVTLQDRDGRVQNDFALQENDEVRVFGAGDFHAPEYVTISGAVRNGGRFAYRRGMTLRDLVLLAGGLGEGAFLEYAELARATTAGGDRSRIATSLRVPLDSQYARGGLDGASLFGRNGVARSSADVALEPHDNVLILQNPDWTTPRSVVVTGNVRFPGRYTLLSRTERLADVLRRAGGLTPEAYVQGMQFYRPEGGKGRVGIDLARVLKDSSYIDNLVLQRGDSIVVPHYAPIVEVVGAVNSPVSVAYVEGASLDYYVRSAGGATRRADVGRTYVTQPNGTVEAVEARRLRPDVTPTPQAGSTVHVPAREDEGKRDVAGMAATAAQVLGALVALVAIVQR